MLTDVRDMFSVHEAFKRGLQDAPAQIDSLREDGGESARYFSEYFAELLWLLHIHHAGEDELMYPKLLERVPAESALFLRMEAQHAAVDASFDTAERAAVQFGRTASAADGWQLADSSMALWSVLSDHLSEEETEVLPFVEKSISEEEWGELPVHAFSQYSGDRMWLPFGLAIEAMPADLLQGMMSSPSPMAQMWNGGGSSSFANEMATIRGTSPG